MIRRIAGLVVVLLTAGCEPHSEEMLVLEAPRPGEIIFANDAHQDLVLVSLEPAEIAIQQSEHIERCGVTQGIARAWDVIRKATSEESIEQRSKLVIDPNRYWAHALVAYVQKLDGDRFEIRYVESDDQMLQAADALETIFAECNLDLTFRVMINRYPE